MTPEPHPDTLLNQAATKQITRGSRQAADTAAMNAMWEVLDRGGSKEEAERIFQETYLKVLYGKHSITMEGNKRRFA